MGWGGRGAKQFAPPQKKAPSHLRPRLSFPPLSALQFGFCFWRAGQHQDNPPPK